MKSEKTFGDTVKALREQQNLTLREVSEFLKIDTSMLGKIEKNNRKPTKELIEKFSKLFNGHLEKLLFLMPLFETNIFINFRKT